MVESFGAGDPPMLTRARAATLAAPLLLIGCGDSKPEKTHDDQSVNKPALPKPALPKPTGRVAELIELLKSNNLDDVFLAIDELKRMGSKDDG